MSLYSAFYASLSGLSSNANSLGVIGNNLANLNTVGYKSSTASFEDLYNTAVGGTSTQGNGDPMQIGLGAGLGSVSQDFSQGSTQASGTVTNMALQGAGFFTLQSAAGATEYSRAGNFSVNKDGFLVDPSGNSVLGWNAVAGTVSTNGTPTPIFLNPGATSAPAPTANISTATNLNSSATVGDTFTTPVAVYDSLGDSHNLLITYKYAGATPASAGPPAVAAYSTWDASATTDGGATVTGFPATLTFDSSGNLTSPTTNPALTLAGWTDGAASQAVNFNIFTAGASSITSYAQSSATSSSTQDGYAAGTVASLSVDDNGNIIGTFTNGQTHPLAQVAVTTFSNPNGLSMQGDNTWATTLASGSPNVGTANSGGRATVLGSNLESSNVDVATEFTKLIINQNGYQANSRVITTADTLLQTVISMIQS